MTTTDHRPRSYAETEMTRQLCDRPAMIDTEFARIVDELTRRKFLTGAVGAAALLGLTACGSGSSASTAPSSPTPSASTRSIDTAKGAVDVPADPARVVAIQPSAFATLCDLGVATLGVYDEGAQYVSPRYLARYDAAPKIGTGGQINVEKVAALRPDLIIGVDYSWNTDVYGDLTKVAPTVIAPSTGWKATARTVADAVNREAKLSDLADHMTQRAAAIKESYAAALARYRWDIVQGGFDAGQYWLYGPGSDIGEILASAGVRFATGSAETPGAGNRALSYEKIDVLGDADVIGFYSNFDGTPNNEAPQLFAQPGFQNLAATKAGRLVPIPDFLPGGYGDALAALDELEAGLKKLQAGVS